MIKCLVQNLECSSCLINGSYYYYHHYYCDCYSVQLDMEIVLFQEIVQEGLETEGREWEIKKLTEINGRAGYGFLTCFFDIFHYQLL